MYAVLIAGVALWIVPHVFKRLAPEQRARLGDRAKGGVAILIVLSIVLMVIGYRQSAYVQLYIPPVWGIHANNLLVLLGFYLFAVSGAKTRLHRYVRHPQLTGFSLWAAGHLLANGNLSAVILFGGLLIWALAEMVLINRAQPEWTPPEPGPIRKEFTSVLATLVLFGVVAWIHTWLGYYPFG
jgi:uncharacterized membrane protein